MADNFFFAAALIGRRAAVFLAVALALGADLPFHFAHRCFIASEMRLRADADMPPVRLAFGGRPRRGRVPPPNVSKAAIACSIRTSSERSSPNKISMFMYPLSVKSAIVYQDYQALGSNQHSFS